MTDDLERELERLGAALDRDTDVLTPEAVMEHPVDAARPPIRRLTVAAAAAVVLILAATASLLISSVERSTPAGPAIATDESTPVLTSEPPAEDAMVEPSSQPDDFVCAPPVGEPTDDVVPFDRIVVESFLRAAATDLDVGFDRCGADPAVFLAAAQGILVPPLGDELSGECRFLSCENLRAIVPELGSVRAYGNGLVTALLQLGFREGSLDPGAHGTTDSSGLVGVGAIYQIANGEIVDAVLVPDEVLEEEVIAQAVRMYLDDLASDDPDAAVRWNDFENGWTPRAHLALIGAQDGGSGPGWADWCALGGRCRDQTAVEHVDLYGVPQYFGSPGGGSARVTFGTGDDAVGVDFWTYVRQGELGVGGLPPLQTGVAGSTLAEVGEALGGEPAVLSLQSWHWTTDGVFGRAPTPAPVLIAADGTLVSESLFPRPASGDGELLVEPIPGGFAWEREIPVADLGALDLGMVDGVPTAFAGRNNGADGVRMIDLETGEISELAEVLAPYGVRNIVSVGGERLAVVRLGSVTSVVFHDLAGRALDLPVPQDWPGDARPREFTAALSSDGSQLAFSTSDDDDIPRSADRVLVADVESGETRHDVAAPDGTEVRTLDLGNRVLAVELVLLGTDTPAGTLVVDLETGEQQRFDQTVAVRFR